MYVGYICTIVFIQSAVSVSLQSSLSSETSSNKDAFILTEGIFERFIRTLIDLLSSPAFPEKKKLPRLFKILYRETSQIKNSYTRKLAKHFKEMSRMPSYEIKSQMEEYRKEYDKQLPKRNEFMKAMNEVFTMRESQQFDDYIYDLRDYGTGDKRLIDEETHKLLNDVIIKNVHRMSGREQRDLQKKLKKAIKEYDNDIYNFDFVSVFDLYNITNHA